MGRKTGGKQNEDSRTRDIFGRLFGETSGYVAMALNDVDHPEAASRVSKADQIAIK